MENDGENKDFTREIIQAGYHPYKSDEETKILNKYNLTRDESLSNTKNRVYHEKEKGKAFVVYPGTKDWNDVGTDLVLATGGLLFSPEKYTPRFREAKRVPNKTTAKYGKDNVTAIGHSLGGALATHSGIQKRVTLDRAMGLSGLGKTVRKGQIDYRTRWDPVSFLLKGSRYSKRAKYAEFNRGKGLLDAHNTKYLY